MYTPGDHILGFKGFEKSMRPTYCMLALLARYNFRESFKIAALALNDMDMSMAKSEPGIIYFMISG
jgi:hypothetical protein